MVFNKISYAVTKFKLNINYLHVLFFLSVVLLFAYALMRAEVVSFTVDESWSYLKFVRKNTFNPFGGEGLVANNHLLNSLLMAGSVKLFGVSEFSLRLPNLLFYLVYLIFTVKLSLKIADPLHSFSVFAGVNFNPYLVEFFSLGRGYGIAVALMTASLYYAFRFIENRQRGNILPAVLTGGLATLANLTMIYFYLPFLISIAYCRLAMANKSDNNKNYWDIPALAFIAAAFIGFAFAAGISLRKAEALFHGLTTGFWSGTISSLINCYFMSENTHQFAEYLIRTLIIIITGSGIILVILKRSKISGNTQVFAILLLFLLLFIPAILTVQQTIFHVKMIYGRTAIFLYPLFFFYLGFLMSNITKHSLLRFLSVALIGLTALLFVIKSNLKEVYEWKHDTQIKDVMHFLKDSVENRPDEKFNKMLFTETVHPWTAINFYRSIAKIHFLNFAGPGRFSNVYDYFHVNPAGMQWIKSDSFCILKSFPEAGTVLIENLHPPRQVRELFYDIHTYENDSSPAGQNITNIAFAGKHGYAIKPGNFSPAIPYEIPDTLDLYDILATCRVKAIAGQQETGTLLVISFQKNEKPFNWTFTELEDFYETNNKWFTASYSRLYPILAPSDAVVSVYLWNLGSRDVVIDDLELKVLAYQFK